MYIIPNRTIYGIFGVVLLIAIGIAAMLFVWFRIWSK